MKQRFNITGACNPQRHYMVNLNNRLKTIREDYIDEGSYFIINRGRQYGKTTILKAAEEYLKEDYIVLSLDFQEIGTEDFADAATFVKAFTRTMIEVFDIMDIHDRKELVTPLLHLMNETADRSLMELFICLSRMCAKAKQPIVLMIDEVDSASNNQVFIDFLSQLRSYYLKRGKAPIFHSVVLAGVYNIKNLKLKLRPESERQYNSPWNIAADFDVEINFSTAQIIGMLEEYEADYHTGMDMEAIAEAIYDYTSGYPEMKQMFRAMLFQGNEFSYNPDTKEINLACMFGYAVNKDGKVRIANRIFETRLYNYFLSEEELSSVMGNMAQRDKNYFIHDGHLDMDMILKKFVEYFSTP